MPIRFLFDENLAGRLSSAVVRHNARGIHPLDVVQVGEPSNLPCGIQDPDVLVWAERRTGTLSRTT